MNLTTALITIGCSSVTAAIITLIFQNKHYRGNLIATWIADLRNELSHLLGRIEDYRLTGSGAKLSDGVRHQIHARKQKIHLLLNDDKDQLAINSLVNKLIEQVDAVESFKKISLTENELVKTSRLLLRKEWHSISRFKFLETAIKTTAVISLVAWLVFYLLDRTLDGVITDAVTAGTVLSQGNLSKATPSTQSPTQSPTQSESPVVRLLSVLQEGALSSKDLRFKLSLSHRPTFRENYLHPALDEEFIELTIPDKPTSRLQQYRLTEKGRTFLENQ